MIGKDMYFFFEYSNYKQKTYLYKSIAPPETNSNGAKNSCEKR
jgi:hypothetical protein